MKKIVSFIIILSMIILAYISSYSCKNEIEKNLNEDLEKLNGSINVLENSKDVEEKIKLNVLEILKILEEYRLDNFEVKYIDDAVSEIRSIKCTILKSKLLLQGYDKKLIEKVVTPYISNKIIDSASIYDIEVYSAYINSILDAVKENNIQVYKDQKNAFFDRISNKIDSKKIELKASFDKTQDFETMKEIEKILDKQAMIKDIKIKETTYIIYKIKYTIIYFAITICMSVIYININKYKIDRSNIKNRNKNLSRRRIRLLEEERNKHKRLIISSIIIFNIISNVICNIAMYKAD